MRIVAFTLIFTLSLISLGFAEELPKGSELTGSVTEVVEEDIVIMPEINESESSKSGRMSSLIQNDGGMKPIEPIDLDKLGDKMLEFGDRSYEALQKGSVPMLVWGIAISAVVLFFGLFVGKAAVVAGMFGLAISFGVFVLIQFAPETAESFLNGVGNLFGK